MKARILFENSQSINSEIGKLDKAQAELNDLNDFLTSHKLGPLTRELALKFKANPAEALRDLYREKIPAVNEFTGLPNDRNRMLEQMRLPEAPRADSLIWVGLAEDALHVFDFGETIEINDGRLQEHLNAWRYITSDPEIISAYEDFKALGKHLDRLNAKLNFIPLNGVHGYEANYRLGDILPLTRRGFELSQKGFMVAVNLLRK